MFDTYTASPSFLCEMFDIIRTASSSSLLVLFTNLSFGKDNYLDLVKPAQDGALNFLIGN